MAKKLDGKAVALVAAGGAALWWLSRGSTPGGEGAVMPIPDEMSQDDSFDPYAYCGGMGMVYDPAQDACIPAGGTAPGDGGSGGWGLGPDDGGSGDVPWDYQDHDGDGIPNYADQDAWDNGDYSYDDDQGFWYSPNAKIGGMTPMDATWLGITAAGGGYVVGKGAKAVIDRRKQGDKGDGKKPGAQEPDYKKSGDYSTDSKKAAKAPVGAPAKDSPDAKKSSVQDPDAAHRADADKPKALQPQPEAPKRSGYDSKGIPRAEVKKATPRKMPTTLPFLQRVRQSDLPVFSADGPVSKGAKRMQADDFTLRESKPRLAVQPRKPAGPKKPTRKPTTAPRMSPRAKLGGGIGAVIGGGLTYADAKNQSRALRDAGVRDRGRRNTMAAAAAVGGFDAVKARDRVRQNVDRYGRIEGRIRSIDDVAWMGIKGTAQGTAQAVMNPVDTAKSIGSGLKEAGKDIKKKARKWKFW